MKGKSEETIIVMAPRCYNMASPFLFHETFWYAVLPSLLVVMMAI